MRHCEGVRSHASLGRAHTRLPLSSATWAHFCISGNRPRAVANLRQREGHWQPTSVTALGGPAASIQLRQGPRAAGGPRNLPTARPGGPHIARWAARCAAAAAAAAGLQPAKHAAGGLEPTPGRCCGLGPRASPSHRTGDSAATGRTSPPERLLPVCSLPIHRLRAAYGSCMLRYQARQLCWRKCRVAAASAGLVCARPKLLGASFACDFDRERQIRRRFVDATQRAGSFARCASSTLISVRSCGLWRLTRRLNRKARSDLRSSNGAPGGSTVLKLQNIAWHAAISLAVSPRNA